jgi:hypothetical protein
LTQSCDIRNGAVVATLQMMQLSFTANDARELGKAVSAMITHGIRLPENEPGVGLIPTSGTCGPQESVTAHTPRAEKHNACASGAQKNPNTP